MVYLHKDIFGHHSIRSSLMTQVQPHRHAPKVHSRNSRTSLAVHFVLTSRAVTVVVTPVPLTDRVAIFTVEVIVCLAAILIFALWTMAFLVTDPHLGYGFTVAANEFATRAVCFVIAVFTIAVSVTDVLFWDEVVAACFAVEIFFFLTDFLVFTLWTMAILVADPLLRDEFTATHTALEAVFLAVFFVITVSAMAFPVTEILFVDGGIIVFVVIPAAVISCLNTSKSHQE